MILLDTNVVSEAMRLSRNVRVQEWLDRQRPDNLYLCTPVLAELYYSAELLPKGTRRAYIEETIGRMEDTFSNRILELDRPAALEYGRIMAQRDRMGRAIGTMDGLIAAIARTNGAIIATRDVRGFDEIGIDVVDPFTAG